jgi:hypothetical protein
MWASADGGTPEVTIETSMGAFTVEVTSKPTYSSLASGPWTSSLPALDADASVFGPARPQMYYKHAPKTCRNFVELARRGYYDNVIFHRIIKVSLFLLWLVKFLLLVLSDPSPARLFNDDWMLFLCLRRISSSKVGILLEQAEVANLSTGEQSLRYPQPLLYSRINCHIITQFRWSNRCTHYIFWIIKHCATKEI